MPPRSKILVTGMSGLIGGVVQADLQEAHDLTALNRSDVPGIRCHRADISDFEAIRPAFEGQDVVIHLAARAHGAHEWEALRRYNVEGTYNVFEAARQAGVKRFIFASSGATISGWERDDPYRALVEGRYHDAPDSWPMITKETPTRPSGIYGASKVWGEAIARHFSDTGDISSICLRIGYVNAENRPLKPRDYSTWCSQRDIARMITLCLAAPADLKFDIFYVLSDNKWGYRDLTHARNVLGFTPQDKAEDHR